MGSFMFANLEYKYLGKSTSLYQNFSGMCKLNSVQNNFLNLNSYNKTLYTKPRFQSKVCLKAVRKNIGFPIRGQRTSSNGKTAKKRLWRRTTV